MVNVNGTPDYGAPARLDDARFLLPVLGVPPEPAADSAADTLTAVVPPDTSKPVRLTMLWPLADRPRLAAGAPGGTTPVRLIDDDLATSLAPGGRLDTLLSAVDFATSPPVDPGGAGAQRDVPGRRPRPAGHRQRDDGAATSSTTPPTPGRARRRIPGAGQDAAVGWLNRLKALAQRMCVAPTTYAQADLDALQRVGDPGLSAIATNGAGDIVDQILGVTSTRGATLVGDGPLTGPPSSCCRRRARRSRSRAANVRRTGLRHRRAGDRRSSSRVRYTPQLVAAPFDPTVGAALAGAGTDPASPSYLDPSLDIPVKHDSAGRPPPGRAGLAAVARPATRHRAAHPDPGAAAGVEPATRRRAGDPHRGGHHHPRRAGRAAAADRGDRRDQRACPPQDLAAAARRRDGQPARPLRRRRRLRHRGGDRPAVGSDGGADHRRAHRADRRRSTPRRCARTCCAR